MYCGALRDEDLPRQDKWDGFDVVRLGSPFPLLNGRRPFLYLKSIFSYNWQLFGFLKKNKPVLVHASDFETLPATVLYRLFYRPRLIYNVHDNLAQRYNVPRFAEIILNTMEGLGVLAADIAAVPEDYRRDALPSWCHKNVVVIRNTPEDAGYSEPPSPTDRISVFFGGWLDWGRGLRELVTLAGEQDDIDLRVAGEGSDDIVAEIEGADGVSYLGFLDHNAVMEETRNCHFIPALYDPSRKINRFAASNKLAEALSVGRPVVLNSELHIAQELGSDAGVLVVDYGEADAIANAMQELASNEDAYRRACQSARRLYEQRYAWEPVRNQIVSAISPGGSAS